jgi:hypothetical protein
MSGLMCATASHQQVPGHGRDEGHLISTAQTSFVEINDTPALAVSRSGIYVGCRFEGENNARPHDSDCQQCRDLVDIL